MNWITLLLNGSDWIRFSIYFLMDFFISNPL